MIRRISLVGVGSIAVVIAGVLLVLSLCPDFGTIAEVVAGALISIVVTVWFEAVRKPDLSLQVYHPGNPDRLTWGEPGGKVGAVLQVDLVHKRLGRALSSLLQRDTAANCQGSIVFYHLDGTPVLDRRMTVRWSNSLQPAHKQRVIECGREFERVVLHSERLTITQHVPTGRREKLDVAVRFHPDADAFGWSNESFYHDYDGVPWKLPQGSYLVEIEINASNAQCCDVFRLQNQGNLDKGFSLAAGTKQDKAIIKDAREKRATS